MIDITLIICCIGIKNDELKILNDTPLFRKLSS